MPDGHRQRASSHPSSPSPQDHYDWGLRAIKSVLVVAGSLKRGDPTRAEDQVLMRALRDFNIPKIVTDDLPVFMGLIGDLFPALDVPRKRDLNFEKVILSSLHSHPEKLALWCKNPRAIAAPCSPLPSQPQPQEPMVMESGVRAPGQCEFWVKSGTQL